MMRDNGWEELSSLTHTLEKAIAEKNEHWCGTTILNLLWTICNAHEHPRVLASGDLEFLFDTAEKANAMADIIELAGADYGKTGYYDPEEDEEDECVDELTGKWYASWD